MTVPTAKTVVILGSQGSGKGTQADLLVEHFSFAHVEVGAILRTAATQDTDQGHDIAARLKTGELLPFDMVMGLVYDKVKEIPAARHVIFDGTPRREAEVIFWEEKLPGIDRAFTDVVFLELNEEQAVERISKRRVCTACKRVCIQGVDRTDEQEPCRTCGGRVEQRNDDTADAVRERLKNFREQTLPLVDHFEERGILRRVNGDQSIEAVHADIIRALGLT